MMRAAAVALLGASLAGEAAPDDVARALAAVRGPAYRAHVAFLADDLLEGRDTGTRGYDVAAREVLRVAERGEGWGVPAHWE